MKKQLNALTKRFKNLARERNLQLRGSDILVVREGSKTCPISILWTPSTRDGKNTTLHEAEEMLPNVIRVFEEVGIDATAVKIRPVRDPRLARRAPREAQLWNFVGTVASQALEQLAEAA